MYVINFILFAITLAMLQFNAFAFNPIRKMTSVKQSKKIKLPAELDSVISHESPKLEVGLAVGQTFLGGNFSSVGNDSITFDLLLNYPASHSFDLLIDFHSSKHSMGQTYAELNALSMGIKGKIYQYDKFGPFLTGGFGFYAPKVKRQLSDLSYTTSESKVVFGIHAGAGIDLKLNDKLKVGVLSELHNPFDIKEANGNIVSGYYYTLLMTAFYSF